MDNIETVNYFGNVVGMFAGKGLNVKEISNFFIFLKKKCLVEVI